MSDELQTRFGDLEIPEAVSHCRTVEEVFECGYCHALAAELHDRTGWRVVGLQLPDRPYEGGPPIPPWFRGDVDHYAVQRPDGLIVDVRGARPLAEVGDGNYRIVYTRIERIRNPSDMERPEDAGDLTRLVADRLLAEMADKPRTSSDLVAASYPTPLRESLLHGAGRSNESAVLAPNAAQQQTPER